jgi:hypothetical protein
MSTGPDSPAFQSALQSASGHIEELHQKLRELYPMLTGTMAIPGMLLGHGLGCLVANGMTDEEIVVQVHGIVAHIRETVARVAANVH